METVLQHRPATYIRFQPDDGTMYLAVVSQVNPKQLFVAIGANPYIIGGYTVNISSLHHMLKDLHKYARDENLQEFYQLPFLGYWKGHLNWLNPVTAICALFVATATLIPPEEIEKFNSVIELQGHVYNNRYKEIVETIEIVAELLDLRLVS